MSFEVMTMKGFLYVVGGAVVATLLLFALYMGLCVIDILWYMLDPFIKEMKRRHDKKCKAKIEERKIDEKIQK